MEQAVRYAQLAKNNSEYLSCLHDIAQVNLSLARDCHRVSLIDHASLRRLSRSEEIPIENLSISKKGSDQRESYTRFS